MRHCQEKQWIQTKNHAKNIRPAEILRPLCPLSSPLTMKLLHSWKRGPRWPKFWLEFFFSSDFPFCQLISLRGCSARICFAIHLCRNVLYPRGLFTVRYFALSLWGVSWKFLFRLNANTDQNFLFERFENGETQPLLLGWNSFSFQCAIS